MYFFIGFLLFLVLFTGLFIWRRRRARKKVCCMSCREKQELLDTILEPFGSMDKCRGLVNMPTRNAVSHQVVRDISASFSSPLKRVKETGSLSLSETA